jgi:glycosyltransferase involved in cell wall biosynthesis
MMQPADKLSRPHTGSFFTVTRRIPHHAAHSGYDLLADFVGQPVTPPSFLFRIRGLGPIHRSFRRRSGMEWYDGLYLEIFTALHMRRNPPSVYHFLFADRHYRYLPSWQPPGKHKVIGTFHAAPSEFTRVMKRTEHLKSLDATIVVAKNLYPLLEPVVGKEKLFFVPLCVDTDYFKPSSASHAVSKRCLCVGHHHRDFDTLAKVATIVNKKDPDVRFVVVDRAFPLYFSQQEQKQILESFNSAGNVQLHTDLNDAELLELYQTSDLMVLPMFEATANVALLEAISCGLPLVVSDIEGVSDYVTSKEAALAPVGDAEAMAVHVLQLIGDRKQREKLSVASREKALHFDWRVIAQKITEVYGKVLSQNL